MECFVKRASGDVNFLAELYKENCISGVLAERHLLLLGDLGIAEQLPEHLPPGWGLLNFQSSPVGFDGVAAQLVVRVETELAHSRNYFLNLDFSHPFSRCEHVSSVFCILCRPGRLSTADWPLLRCK